MNDSTTNPSPPFAAAAHASDNKLHLLLACTGSVATIKLPLIIRSLARHSHLSIRVLLTPSAAHFLQGQSAEQPSTKEIAGYANVDAVYVDADEWSAPWTRGAPILHIELRRWADLLVVAPLGANALAKMACGMCDGLLLSVVRAWDAGEGEDGGWRRIVVAPAMNTAMWRHPLTEGQLAVLRGWGWVDVLRPVERTLACGDTGDGAMCAWADIVVDIQERLERLRTRVEE